MSTLEKPYGRRERPGHHITRVTKGDPRKIARRQRAQERQPAEVTVQQRFVVKKASTFEEAHEAKKSLQIKYPDDHYKIRRVSGGFNVVKRFKINEVKRVVRPGKTKVSNVV